MTSPRTRLILFGYGTTVSSPHLLYCKECGIEFKNGEVILTKTRGRSKKAHYHKKCAERLNII